MIERAHIRKKVLWHAEVHRENGPPMRCLVLEISAGGARIRTEAQFPLGSIVKIVIGSGEVALPGEIEWQSGMQAGISFLEESSSVQASLRKLMPTMLEPAPQERRSTRAKASSSREPQAEA